MQYGGNTIWHVVLAVYWENILYCNIVVMGKRITVRTKRSWQKNTFFLVPSLQIKNVNKINLTSVQEYN